MELISRLCFDSFVNVSSNHYWMELFCVCISSSFVFIFFFLYLACLLSYLFVGMSCCVLYFQPDSRTRAIWVSFLCLLNVV